MKKFVLSLSVAALFFAACKERNNLINFRPETESLFIDSSYDGPVETAQPKNVHIEDFTGVKCPNCPKAQQKAEEITAKHDEGRIVVTAIHVTSLADPYPESKYDFRTNDATNIFSMLGKDPGALPMGDLNRKIFPGKTSPFIAFPEWDTRASAELAESTPVNIRFHKKEFNDVTRELSVSILVTYTAAVPDTNYISVALKESDIIDIQAQPTGHPDTNYVHNHVLRAMVAPYNGLMLGSNMQPGMTYMVSFKRKLDEKWDADHFSIAAFVHNRGKNLEVLQVQETEVK